MTGQEATVVAHSNEGPNEANYLAEIVQTKLSDSCLVISTLGLN